MVAEALKGKTPSESPTFYALVGAPGSGKSTLASTIDNAVVISSDHVIAEYAKTLGIDIREDFCDREVGRFATVVSNEIYKAAVKNKMNIVLTLRCCKIRSKCWNMFRSLVIKPNSKSCWLTNIRRR